MSPSPENSKRIYLSPPHMGTDELELVKDAFATNWIAPLGPHVDAFERELGDYVGGSRVLALSSGTAALELCARSLNIGPGDFVLCPSLTFVATIAPFIHMGAFPVFVDSEPETWNLSPRALENALRALSERRRKAKAVILVNLYGQPCDMDPLLEICARYDAAVIEDAAESLGATYKGRQTGTFGRYGVFSFNGNKIITTGGGGALLADEGAIDKARFWSTQARDKAPWYQHSDLGYNFRLSNVLAAIGRGQLRLIEDRVARRRQIFERYRTAMNDIVGVAFMPEIFSSQPDPGTRSTRWLSVMTLSPGNRLPTPAQVIEGLAALNIEARYVWKPMHLQPIFEAARYAPHEMGQDVAANLFETGVCLPSGSSMTDEDLERVIGALRNVLTQPQKHLTKGTSPSPNPSLSQGAREGSKEAPSSSHPSPLRRGAGGEVPLETGG